MQPTFRNSQDAFADAIDQGELSNDPQADNFAGNYMYMHSDQPIGTDSFKHRMTRRYLHVQRPAVLNGLFAAAKR